LTVKRFAISLIKYGLLGIALLVTAGLSALTTMRLVLKSQEVVVPALVGRTMPEAGTLASRHKLQIKVEGRRNDPKVPPDRIVEQEPPAGSGLKTQRSIRVWVSLGPRKLVVPQVVGESIRSGRLALDQAQVPVGRIVETNDASEEGTVLLQQPPPGETETLGPDGASLLVSLGPHHRDVVMPDLIGRPASIVLETLQAVGLKVADVRYRQYPGVAPGLVLRQLPLAGHRVSPQSSITLDVSQETP
jgi:serine/threonine-protein kinase